MTITENGNEHILHHFILPHDHFPDLGAECLVFFTEEIYCFYV